MSRFFDNLETRNPQQREAELFARLPEFLAKTMENAPGWAKHLQGLDAAIVTDRKALADLPVLRKSELMQRQSDDPPLAGFAAVSPENYGRVFMSPGPIFETQGPDSDPWCGARALFAAGFNKGDLIHNSFSYHLTPGGFILDYGARALGCAVFPAGTGNSELQVDAIAQLKPQGYTGTPDYLKILLDKAQELGKDASSIKRALVSGGALFPSMRAEYQQRGVDVLQCYATADLGVIAYESEAMEGMIINENMIVEIVRPGTGEPVTDGEVGEVLVTNFNTAYPMIRFATGDLSAIMPGQSPCGRTNARIKGWMGRADQTVKVKGMFIHPSQIAEIGKAYPGAGRMRLVVSRDGASDSMCLMVESKDTSSALTDKIAKTIQAICKVRGKVQLVTPGELANDGQVIVDERDYEA